MEKLIENGVFLTAIERKKYKLTLMILLSIPEKHKVTIAYNVLSKKRAVNQDNA